MIHSLMRAWRLIVLVAAILVIAAGGTLYYFRAGETSYQTLQEKDPAIRFDMEAYDQIIKNYWVKPGSYSQFGLPELPQLFALAAQKTTGSPQTLATSTRSATAEMLAQAFKSATSTEAERTLAVQTLQVVLYNLAPAGRDGLLSKQQETALRQNVANVNPDNNLYQNLGLAKGASAEEVNAAYQKKAEALKTATSSEAAAELKQVAYAHEVLSAPVGKALYDQTGAEPSVFSHVYGTTLYLDFDKISPTTLQEFALAINAASTTPLSGLILDMRGNVGGQLSFAQDFLGLFIGGNQYAFDLYHQGNTEVQRTTQTKFDELARFKSIAVLTDNQTQSTAELTTAALKRFRLAVAVGTKTRGWGSVEDTYPITTTIDPSTSYSLLLVNHLTLRDDGQPIEGNGVIPDVDTSQTGWQKKLSQYFDSSFAAAVAARASAEPVR